MDYCFATWLLIFSLINLSASPLRAEDEQGEQALEAQPFAVALSKSAQVDSGLKTIIVHQSAYGDEYESVGKVISVEPLLALRSQYKITLAELKSAEARLKQAELTFKRQQELFQNGISAKRSLQEFTTQRLMERAAVDAAQARLAELSNTAHLQWGEKLAGWITGADSSHLKALLSGKQVLLQVIVPGNRQLSGSQPGIMVEPQGMRERASPASFVSKSTQVDNASQGESYFFLCGNYNLRVGMKVIAWLKQPGTGDTGIIVPQSALIWHLGQAFTYTKVAEGHFARRNIRRFRQAGQGYLVEGDLQDGDEVVSEGGQMLLSEEMRQHIPDED